MEELSALLEGMSPEELEQLLQLGGLAEQSGDVQGQIDALRQNRGPRNVDYGGSAVGAAMGGLGDIFRGIHSKADEKRLLEEKAGLRGEQTKGRSLLAQLLAKRGLPPGGGAAPVPPAGPPAGPAAAAEPSTPFGFGRNHYYG